MHSSQLSESWILLSVATPLLLQELEAARARAESDKKKAKLTADLEKMRRQLEDLSEQAAAKQATVRLELQQAKLKKELQLQV
jgi:hypothetical protein